MADGVVFGQLQFIERTMQVVSAIATIVTVTAGCAYVAHVASTAPIHWLKRSALALLWLPLLVASGGLAIAVAPGRRCVRPLSSSCSRHRWSASAPALCVPRRWVGSYAIASAPVAPARVAIVDG